MSASIDQKAYLQKYLNGPSGDKKKKKKKPVKGKGFKIIDDDIDLSKLRPLDGDELDILNEGEDAPQIAGIIDDRPDELKKLDYQTSKWRVINQDDGFNSKLQIQEVRKDKKEVEKENEIIFGKMYSDSEDEKDNTNSPRTNETAKKKKHNSDSDFSPPRRSNKNDDSDVSPPRKSDKNKDDLKSSKRTKNDKKYDSDVSPPRKHKHDKVKTRRNSKDSDVSPKIRDHSKSRINYDSDQSPPRKSNKNEMAKVRRKNIDNDSDLSPPRKHRKDDKPKNRRKASDNDSDVSPPRKRNKDGGQKIRNNSDRRHENISKERTRKTSRWGGYDESFKRKSRSPERNKSKNYDSDASPPRKRRSDKNRTKVSDSDESPPRRNKSDSNKKMEKTLDGKKAGLQDAGQLKDENAAFRRREDEAFRNMTDEMSGRNAHAVSRKGRRETSEDRQKQREKAERQKMLDEKYKLWSKGLKQIEAHQASVQDFLHEASKPLARYKDDTDLESKLKDVERAGDPMLKYIREKKRDRGELGPEKPTYKGQFPPNRFNIRPGYRWDGVDRSSGYEKKFFDNQSKRKAQEEEAYKWSTEDL